MGVMTPTVPVLIRRLNSDDAASVTELSEQLGYPASVADIRERLNEIAGSADRVGFAAVSGDLLLGWIDASVERHLQGSDCVVIGGLVVRDSARGMGLGRRLCEEVEAWSRGRSIPVVRVRSQIKRADAHRFYLRDGYQQVKTSVVFEKKVLPE